MDSLGIHQCLKPDICDLAYLLPFAADVLKENRDIVIASPVAIAPGARAEQHHALNASAVMDPQSIAKSDNARIYHFRSSHGDILSHAWIRLPS